MLKEFRDFAFKGNMLDLAIGVIIGASFGTLIKSLVDDIIMPPVSLLLGNVDASQLFIVIKKGIIPPPYLNADEAMKSGAVLMKYGNFINNIIHFIIISFSIFIFIMNVSHSKKEAR